MAWRSFVESFILSVKMRLDYVVGRDKKKHIFKMML